MGRSMMLLVLKRLGTGLLMKKGRIICILLSFLKLLMKGAMVMKEFKTSPEQLAKNREYKRIHKDRLRVQGYRSKAVLYIREHATLEDLKELKIFIEEKEKELLSD